MEKKVEEKGKKGRNGMKKMKSLPLI